LLFRGSRAFPLFPVPTVFSPPMRDEKKTATQQVVPFHPLSSPFFLPTWLVCWVEGSRLFWRVLFLLFSFFPSPPPFQVICRPVREIPFGFGDAFFLFPLFWALFPPDRRRKKKEGGHCRFLFFFSPFPSRVFL